MQLLRQVDAAEQLGISASRKKAGGDRGRLSGERGELSWTGTRVERAGATLRRRPTGRYLRSPDWQRDLIRERLAVLKDIRPEERSVASYTGTSL